LLERESWGGELGSYLSSAGKNATAPVVILDSAPFFTHAQIFAGPWIVSINLHDDQCKVKPKSVPAGLHSKWLEVTDLG